MLRNRPLARPTTCYSSYFSFFSCFVAMSLLHDRMPPARKGLKGRKPWFWLIFFITHGPRPPRSPMKGHPATQSPACRVPKIHGWYIQAQSVLISAVLIRLYTRIAPAICPLKGWHSHDQPIDQNGSLENVRDILNTFQQGNSKKIRKDRNNKTAQNINEILPF